MKAVFRNTFHTETALDLSRKRIEKKKLLQIAHSSNEMWIY